MPRKRFTLLGVPLFSERAALLAPTGLEWDAPGEVTLELILQIQAEITGFLPMAMLNHALRPKMPVLFVGIGPAKDGIDFSSASMRTLLFQAAASPPLQLSSRGLLHNQR